MERGGTSGGKRTLIAVLLVAIILAAAYVNYGRIFHNAVPGAAPPVDKTDGSPNWQVEPEELPVIKLTITPWKMWWTSDGKYLIAYSSNWSAFQIAVPSARKIVYSSGKEHEVGIIRAMAVSPDGQGFATGSGKTVELYSLPGPEKHGSAAFEAPVISLAYTADSRYLVAGLGAGLIAVLDAESGNVVSQRRDEGHDTTECLAISPDSQLLVTGSYIADRTLITPENDGLFGVWQLPSLTPIVHLPVHAERPVDVMFTGDGKYLLTFDNGMNGISWKVDGFSEIRTFSPPFPANDKEGRTWAGTTWTVGHSRLAPGGREVLWDMPDYMMRAYTVPDFKMIGAFANRQSDRDAAFPETGDVAAVGYYDGSVGVFDLKTHESLYTLIPKKTKVVGDEFSKLATCVAFSPDGRYLAAAIGENSVFIWKAALKPASARENPGN